MCVVLRKMIVGIMLEALVETLIDDEKVCGFWVG